MKSQAQNEGQKRILSRRKEITDFRKHLKYPGSNNIFKLRDISNPTFCYIISLASSLAASSDDHDFGRQFSRARMQNLNAISPESAALARTVRVGRGVRVWLTGGA